jgi:hypothetical protein
MLESTFKSDVERQHMGFQKMQSLPQDNISYRKCSH